MSSVSFIFTLAAVGLSETAYLIRKHLTNESPTCIIGQEEQCLRVLESKYNNIFGIPNEILGFVFYLIISTISVLLVLEINPIQLWDLTAKVLISIGAMMSLGFTYIQWRIIKAWCTWCLISATTIFLMLYILIINGFTLI